MKKTLINYRSRVVVRCLKEYNAYVEYTHEIAKRNLPSMAKEKGEPIHVDFPRFAFSFFLSKKGIYWWAKIDAYINDIWTLIRKKTYNQK